MGQRGFEALRNLIYNPGMLGVARIEAYRVMTPEQRWQEVRELTAIAWHALMELPQEERNRRLEIVRREHDASDSILLDRLRCLR